MNIVILDGHALNPGDLSWQGFYDLGNVTLFERTSHEQVVERAKNADILITNKVSINAEIMDSCKNLKYIGVLATGYNIIDVKAAAERNIIVTNIPSYSSNAVVQAVFAFLLEITNGVNEHNKAVFNGEWCNSLDFCFWNHNLTEIAGKTLGIYGFGDIGQKVALTALAFGMKVNCTTRTHEKVDSFNKKIGNLFESVKCVDFNELLATSDVISLHAPLTEQTKYVINAESLKLVKSSAILINTARGPLVDELAVTNALNSEKLGFYAADVLSAEPMAKDNPLLNAKNCIITPHVAWAGYETRVRLMNIATNNLASFLKGTPINTV